MKFIAMTSNNTEYEVFNLFLPTPKIIPPSTQYKNTNNH